MTEPIHQDFQWVMSGGVMPDGSVQIIASQKIDPYRSELVCEYPNRRDYIYFNRVSDHDWNHREYTLRVGLLEWVIIQAPTYAEAFAKLFEQWTPPTVTPLALPPAQPLELS